MPGAPPLTIGINAGYLILTEKYQQAVQQGKIMINENRSSLSNVEKLLTGRLDCYINDRKTILFGMNSLLEDDSANIAAGYEEKEYLYTRSAHIGYSKRYLNQHQQMHEFVAALNTAIQHVLTEQ